MLSKWQYWVVTGAAVLVAVLAFFNATLFLKNRALQVRVNERQQYIMQSIQLEGLYREMVKAMADLSTKNNDEQLRDLLKAHGFTITASPAQSTPPRGSKK